ncbi:LPS-assembly lipoprotein [Rhodoferax ferrireducens]|uniref:LPS-assembly lipoprotein LptE n=1 Tax=Rhodoferax ferrireducens TaxID=192843 RepID=A0ABU2CG58_9BURK|nr:LPS assembly lipoprotein LptE [Rhodoferax ferrireducens]MDR7380324.1 LPS-assembly lipoprotein [Rhodoferax ferrireducens]
MRRRNLLLAAPALGLTACGFALRQAPTFAFSTIFVRVAEASSLGNELKRNLTGSGLVVISDAKLLDTAQVVLDVVSDQREKSAASLTSAGQVREFQLRVRMKFRLRTPQGKELIPDVELLQQRDISYSETQALGKEAEVELLYRSMQTDIVQQIMRRLAAVKEI